MIAGTVANFDSNTINSSGLIIKDRNLVNAGRMNNPSGGTVTVCSINSDRQLASAINSPPYRSFPTPDH